MQVFGTPGLCIGFQRRCSPGSGRRRPPDLLMEDSGGTSRSSGGLVASWEHRLQGKCLAPGQAVIVSAVMRLTDKVLLCWGTQCSAARLGSTGSGQPFQQKITGLVRNRPQWGLQTSARPASLLQCQEPSPKSGQHHRSGTRALHVVSSAWGSSSTSRPFPCSGHRLPRGSRRESRHSPTPCGEAAHRATGTDPQITLLRRADPQHLPGAGTTGGAWL